MSTTITRDAAYHRLADEALESGTYAIGEIGGKSLVAVVGELECRTATLIHESTGQHISFYRLSSGQALQLAMRSEGQR